MDELLKTFYTGSRDSEKRRVLEHIIQVTSEERGAWMNCDIPYSLSFILLTAIVNDMRDILRLEKRINALEESLKSLDRST